MSIEVTHPYEQIMDKNGKPLDNGLIYVGESGQNPEVYPIQVFYDELYSLPVPQPIRTINGYFSRNGSPAKIFTKETSFSIIIKDKFKIVQFSDLYASGVISGSGLNIFDVNGGMASVKSISGLRGIVKPKSGQVVFVESYFDPEDSSPKQKPLGGGFFVWNERNTNADDGGIYIKPNITISGCWVRQNVAVPDVQMFGAVGNWNARNQTGADDTVAFQSCVSHIIKYGQNYREGGIRSMYIPAGNYRLDGFTVTQGAAYFTFNIFGDGLNSQLWFNPNGTGILLEQENTTFRRFWMNGKLAQGMPTTISPALRYIVQAKLSNKLLDVDLHCEDVGLANFNTGFRISGRGFTFLNSSVGFGNDLFELALDPDLVIAGDTPAIHSLQTSLRHYKIHNNRFDVVSRIMTISGTHELRKYINGLTISENEGTLMNRVILSNITDSCLIAPEFSNNLYVGCFPNSNPYNLNSAKDVLDVSNRYYNLIDESAIATSADAITRLYNFTADIDGLTIVDVQAKDIRDMLVRTSGVTNNINIIRPTLKKFGDTNTGNTFLLYSDRTPRNVTIDGVYATGLSNISRAFIGVTDGGMGSNATIFIAGNHKGVSFGNNYMSFTPNILVNGAVNAGISYTAREAGFVVNANYIEGFFNFAISTALTSGTLGFTLPVPAIADNSLFSSFRSGNGEVNQFTGMPLEKVTTIIVNGNTDQSTKIIQDGVEFNLSNKTSSAIGVWCTFKYRFK